MTDTTEIRFKPANCGSISTATLRAEDLLNVLGDELEWQIRRNGDWFALPENRAQRDRLNALVGEAQDCWAPDGGSIDEDKEDVAQELIDETLPQALGEFCMAYFYFGAHPGDGADFGYWVDPAEVARQIKEDGGFVSTKAQDRPPADYVGEWLQISDHGNSTLYVRDDQGGDTEVWGVV